MHELDEAPPSSRLISLFHSMLSARKSIFNDTLLPRPSHPIHVLMDTSSFYKIFQLSKTVPLYFKNNELED